MADYEYPTLEVVQQPEAPPFYISAVPARELLAWCDVPRAKGGYMAGYQRSLDHKRSDVLAEYIGLSPRNIVPGAVIVAIDQDYVDLDRSGPVSLVRVTPDTRDFQTKLEELFGAFTTRMSNEELASADIGFSSDDWDEDQEVDAEHPSSYLALLAQELNTALQSWDDLQTERQDAIREYIEGVSKPGLIIDGQHRVFGASRVDHDVLMPVVLLPGLEYAEQVFQFYVLNSKAKPLRPTELRRIVSTTLTNSEIESLYDRFKQAGITAEEARWTLEMNTRAESPFRNRIDFGYGVAGAVIKENVADQIVRGFMKMPAKRYKQLSRPLGAQWSDLDSRLEIFFWLWAAIREEYSTTWTLATELADTGRQHTLFLKVALLTLQKFVLDRFVTALPYRGDAPPPLSSEDEVRSMVESTLKNLPGEFFEREWKMKQVDTSEGRKELYLSMEEVWNNHGKVNGNMRLFKG
jgi:hypothetical protein